MAYKLQYFNGRGLAEPIRMILSVGGQEFEDNRIPIVGIPSPIPEEIKKKCTWGQVPLIEFEGKKLCQSLAITRYFAKKYNLVGADDFEAAQCDEYVDACRDLMTSWMPAIMEKDEEKKAELIKSIEKTVRERFLVKFNEIVEANGGQRLVGDKLTWADIYLAHVLNNAEILQGLKFVDDYPALKSLYDTVFSVPQIKAWVAKRPLTKF